MKDFEIIIAVASIAFGVYLLICLSAYRHYSDETTGRLVKQLTTKGAMK